MIIRADQRRRRGHQCRSSASRGRLQGGVPAELQRLDRRAHHTRRPTCPSRSPPPARRPPAPAT
jgi:hypothetical protein